MSFGCLLRGLSAFLDWFHYLLCEFMLDDDGVQLVALRLGRSGVVFGNESNLRNMPVEGGLKPLAALRSHLKIS